MFSQQIIMNDIDKNDNFNKYLLKPSQLPKTNNIIILKNEYIQTLKEISDIINKMINKKI